MIKPKYILSFLLFLLTCSAIGQSIPYGMNYQAIARDVNGDLLQDQVITLKIMLQNKENEQPVIYYSEIHRITTNHIGLFNLVIGKGSTLSGDYNQIPWSTENIWLAVSIKLNGENTFTNLNSVRLLAVPYAMHAGVAGQISGTASPYVIPGTSPTSTGGNSIFVTGPTPAASWNTPGTLATNPPTDFFGTGDLKDLVFKTNLVERIRILSSGSIYTSNSTTFTVGVDLTVGRDVNITRDLSDRRNTVVDSNFTVKQNASFNTLGGSTINNGPFTVEKNPSTLTGSLRVNQITNLQGGLNVNNATPTVLDGTLQVNGTTDLYNNFTVNSRSSSALTGKLRVDSNVTFKQHLTLDNPNLNSSSWSNGALITAGGIGIRQNLNVGDSATFGGPVGFKGQVKITDTRPSFTPDSGALIVSGGVGIGRQLNVALVSHLYDTMKVDRMSKLENTLNVSGSTTIQDSLNVSGQVTINRLRNSPALQSNYNDYPLVVQGREQGLAVKVQNNRADNNYVTFMDNANGMQGCIEGYAAGQYNLTPEYLELKKEYDDALLDAQLNLATAAVNLAASLADLAAAYTSSTACVGLIACFTMPIPSLGIVTAIKTIGAAVAVGIAEVALFKAQDNSQDLEDAVPTKYGVTYRSGAGDYAEYLKMLNPNESMFPGDIVGLKGGKVTRNTEGADKIMVISKRPIVLGNMPDQEVASEYKKVAFLGQVPVQVIGKVNAGDYIIPDGNNMGMGKALPSSALSPSDVKKILGVAWSSSEKNKIVSTINVAVGLNVNDNQSEVDELQKEINALKEHLDRTESVFEKMIVGYNKNSVNLSSSNAVNKNQSTEDNSKNLSPDKRVYYTPLQRNDFAKTMNIAIKEIREKSTDKNTLLFIKQLDEDPLVLEQFIDKTYAQVTKELNRKKELDRNPLK